MAVETEKLFARSEENKFILDPEDMKKVIDISKTCHQIKQKAGDGDDPMKGLEGMTKEEIEKYRKKIKAKEKNNGET